MIAFKLIRKFIKGLWYRVAKFGQTLCLTSSVALGFASVIGGMYLKSVALLSISCVAVGCFLSGIFFNAFLAKLLEMSKSQPDDRARREIKNFEEQLEKEQSKHKAELKKLEETISKLHAGKETAQRQLKEKEQEIADSREKEQKVLEQLNAVKEDHQREISQKDTEISSLQAECTRLGKQSIDVTALRPVLELALAEVKMNIKDVKITWDHQSFVKEGSRLGILPSSAECQQYTGVIEHEFKAKFGIDMRRLTVHWSPERRTITVYGMKAVHIGNQSELSKWLLREVKKFKLKNLGNDERHATMKETADGFWRECNWYEKDQSEIAEASLDLNEIKNHYEEQERVLRRRVSEGGGEEFKPIQDYVANMGKAVIRCLLAPVLKAYEAEIQFSENPNENGETLEEFLVAYNSSPDQREKQITGGVGGTSGDVKMVR